MCDEVHGRCVCQAGWHGDQCCVNPSTRCAAWGRRRSRGFKFHAPPPPPPPPPVACECLLSCLRAGGRVRARVGRLDDLWKNWSPDVNDTLAWNLTSPHRVPRAPHVHRNIPAWFVITGVVLPTASWRPHDVSRCTARRPWRPIAPPSPRGAASRSQVGPLPAYGRRRAAKRAAVRRASNPRRRRPQSPASAPNASWVARPDAR